MHFEPYKGILARPVFDYSLAAPQRFSSDVHEHKVKFTKDNEKHRKCAGCQQWIRRENEKCPKCNARTPRGHLFKDRNTKQRIKHETRR